MSENRVMRMEYLLGALESHGGEMAAGELYTEFIPMGICWRTYLEYLKCLKLSGKITYNDFAFRGDRFLIRLVEVQSKKRVSKRQN